MVFLKDDALDFACKLSPDVQNNISQFRDALQRRYGDSRLPEQYREDLANIKKHFKETLPEYAARVENLVCRGYPHLKEINLLNLEVENFLKGLPDQSIACEVKIRKPQSIDDAIEWFNWHECCKGNIFKKRAEVRQIELRSNPSVDISSVDVVIDRVRAVTLRVPIVIEGDYLNAVIDTGAEVTVMSQEKFLKIPEKRRPQIYKAERN
ncbi:unnamed protein product [Mytilus edulis]|uniref:Peptidase A2 domain-containing protein n=1 Tax=Mytilus edulis TaxID=6550 RepID=A0A8S3S7F9_MYTED|nr:unnamed protein product [Mytilus edulis]